VYGCWDNDESIKQFMIDKSMTSYDELLSYFVNKADKLVRNQDSTPIHWQEIFYAGSNLPLDTIYQVWTDSSQIAAVTSAGYRVIASPSDMW
jgi:N-acetyl-beta-hexosaminidase